MSNITLAFPKVIYKSKLSTLDDSLITQYKQYIDSDIVKIQNGNGYLTNNQFILNESLFESVKQEIIHHVLEYVKILSHKVNSVDITSSWGNVIDKNNSIYNHVHGNSYISGVFYLTGGSSLCFYTEDVYKDFTFSPEIEFDANKPWTSSVMSIPAEIGNIVLFPSMLRHSVDQNNSDNKRYSVAFNTIPTGMIGSITNKLQISPHSSAGRATD